MLTQRHGASALVLRWCFGLGTAASLGAACGEANDNQSSPGTGGAAAGATGGGHAGVSNAGTSSGSGAASSAGTSSAGHGGALGGGGSPASGGVDEPGASGSGGDSASLAGADSGAGGNCQQACAPEPQSVFCSDDEVSWVCHGVDFDQELFRSECTDAGTNAIRYCCLAAFQGECP